MRLLIIDNNIDPNCWGSADLRRSVAAHAGITTYVRRAPHDDLPAPGTWFDRLIVSGSKTSCLADAAWIEKLHGYIRSWLDTGKPYLGVCYGHQSLTRVLSGREAVRKGKEGELGWTRIERSGHSRLFEGLPSSFYSFSSHWEEASKAPSGFQVIAKSEACAIQAIESTDRPIFGIQFHPERNLEEAEKTFGDTRKEDNTRPLMGFGQSSQLFDPLVSQTIFGNFLRL